MLIYDWGTVSLDSGTRLNTRHLSCEEIVLQTNRYNDTHVAHTIYISRSSADLDTFEWNMETCEAARFGDYARVLVDGHPIFASHSPCSALEPLCLVDPFMDEE